VRFRAAIALPLLAAALLFPTAAQPMGSPSIAALQVTLRARDYYRATIDGIKGPRTRAAIRRFQSRAGLAVDGIVGPRTRAALGRYARHRLGSRPVRVGTAGWDVASLQFLLAWHGFPSGRLDGRFGPRTDAAVRRYQRWRKLTRDGVAGPVTIRSLRSPLPRSPIVFRRPVRAAIGDRFGPRGNAFHTGIDFTAWYGATVRAGARGRVVRASWNSGGYGYLVTLQHRRRVRSLYAHLSRILVRRGQWISAGTRLGRVGATGHATGPHLHFELRLRGAAVNPITALR
jgi:murein DD-endopeptidase MepM/ murein hydrolase activator NlpD